MHYDSKNKILVSRSLTVVFPWEKRAELQCKLIGVDSVCDQVGV